MISASVAREIAEKNNNAEDERQTKAIEKVITQAAEGGKFSAYYYENLSMTVRDNLEQQGYRIKDNSSLRDGVCWTISW